MTIGTKSILFGAHCFFLHPFFVARAWWIREGFPFDPRLWFAFFLHDIGYWGKPNMDGPEGETHPELGAAIMHKMFDWGGGPKLTKLEDGRFVVIHTPNTYWRDFCLFHSRSYAKLVGADISKLCYSDKFAFTIQPKWLYLLNVRLTGEYKEYVENARRYNESLGAVKIRVDNLNNWHADLVKHFYSVVKA